VTGEGTDGFTGGKDGREGVTEDGAPVKDV
jgi:hypothetical protein